VTDVLISPLNTEATDKVLALYQAVASHGGGLARRPDEISQDYVRAFLNRAKSDGVTRAIWAPDGSISAEIHAYRMVPRQFQHVLTDLTIAVHPDCQGSGYGSLLFKALVEGASKLEPRITRIELFVRSGNAGAIRLYERLGFVFEGRFANRVRLADGTIEDDVAMALLL
jgi:ribosomal protein S18 acetylase RimI-like enzyme